MRTRQRRSALIRLGPVSPFSDVDVSAILNIAGGWLKGLLIRYEEPFF